MHQKHQPGEQKHPDHGAQDDSVLPLRHDQQQVEQVKLDPGLRASSGGLYSRVGGIMAIGYLSIPLCYCSTAIAAAPRASWEKICV